MVHVFLDDEDIIFEICYIMVIEKLFASFIHKNKVIPSLLLKFYA
jgi:hypothetical protein